MGRARSLFPRRDVIKNPSGGKSVIIARQAASVLVTWCSLGVGVPADCGGGSAISRQSRDIHRAQRSVSLVAVDV